MSRCPRPTEHSLRCKLDDTRCFDLPAVKYVKSQRGDKGRPGLHRPTLTNNSDVYLLGVHRNEHSRMSNVGEGEPPEGWSG